MSTPTSFATIFAKENNFCDFLLASWTTNAFQNGVYSWMKEFSPKEKIGKLSFKSKPQMEKETKMKMTELLPLKVYPITIN